MKQAPRPLAVFAANDQLAVDVLEACEQAGLSVPEQVAIVGAENYLLAVDAMRTPISSVDTNLEEQGYEGAALLDRLMNGERSPGEPIRVPASRVATRKSSDILAVNHHNVAKGLRFVWENFQRQIGVDDVAQAAGMSRRGLHQAFLEHLERTPGEEIRNARVEHAKKLLVETGNKVEAIAGLSGYQSANSFCVAFKKEVGASPVAFRKASRHAR
jgi:LacI family transcriptional regulator